VFSIYISSTSSGVVLIEINSTNPGGITVASAVQTVVLEGFSLQSWGSSAVMNGWPIIDFLL
jgi:hypothetical protein